MPASATALCRDCDWESADADGLSCPACRSERILRHTELGALAIAHVDCDAFYATIEKRDDPALGDKPVLVGGSKRGVVAAACYIARRYGIRSAMPMFKALEACPHAVVVPPDMEKYSRIGRQVRDIMTARTPLVEPLSIDEAFLDLGGTEGVHGGSPARTMAAMAREIEAEIGITVSVGLSYNKFLAKIASDLDKPRGFAVIGKAEAEDFLSTKPVGLLWGVGAALQKRLANDNIHRIGELRQYSEAELVRRYGAIGTRLARFSRGDDRRTVKPGRPAKSVSSETTFNEDIRALDKLTAKLWKQCDRVGRRMRKNRLIGRTATLKLRTADFKILTRSRTLPAPTQSADILFQAALALLEREADGRYFRLIGVGLSGLESEDNAPMADLFGENDARAAALEKTVDDLRDRFGVAAPVKGRSLGPKAK
ncbi:MAG: DNA polymerase IV [Rhodospirillaceae bacterium]|nr:DNA polymerase IV [Rhodospirillaceae bacterium]